MGISPTEGAIVLAKLDVTIKGGNYTTLAGAGTLSFWTMGR
ncbi:hypothetical protein ENSA5_37570 [Enhygromyxa salina]|uniref:Uncharacterized protein n=1 Tax=Enhygromyxa salina TaxID=215803 RepID=A0A2S9XSP5_9BACT|nr:hypothetical protein ENSA5_37570 [Enhygromyxa salina]